MQTRSLHCLITVVFIALPAMLNAQMITGTWKGKINRQKVEVKIIQNGDSLAGTSYYYESAGNYRRYSIKGYFDTETNNAVWWDDQLLEEKSGRFSISTPGKVPLLSRADFNCPGSGRMMLDGKVSKKETADPSGEVHLDKIGAPEFDDEWNFVIDNYTVGANDPYLIDSIAHIHDRRVITAIVAEPEPVEKTIAINPAPPKKIESVPVPEKKAITEEPKPVLVKNDPPKTEPVKTVMPVPEQKVPTIEEKFVTRKKVLTKEIPLGGDSLELRFYDNAEVDGDSISLFLNDKLLFTHIRLTAVAYTIKLAIAELAETNELIMVAENLGSIPPNTSYMLAIVDDKRYDAYLSSTEGSSAMIRFTKKN